MSPRSLVAAALLIGPLINSAPADDNPAGADGLPQLELYGPNSNDTYQDSSSIAISGRVDPPLEIDVKIWLYHVVDDEHVLPEGGANTHVGPEGRFSVTLFPRAGGWTAGRLRCVVSGGMRTLRQSVEFRVIEHSEATPITLPKDSEITIDVGELASPEKPYRVVAGQSFYLTGGFEWATEAVHVQGPRFSVRIIHFDPVLGRDIIAQSHGALTYIYEPGIAVFDAPIVAPPRPGAYILQMRRPVVSDGKRTYETIERPLSVDPAAD